MYISYIFILTSLCRPQGVVSNLLIGGAAGTCAATVCYPLDTVRRRMQVKSTIYRSQLHALATIWRTEGWRGYYRCENDQFLSGFERF